VFGSYKSGVLSGSACGTKLDHAVVAIGYGMENGMDYVLIRNSWGAGWGDKGYIKLEHATGEGTCGVNIGPWYPETN